MQHRLYFLPEPQGQGSFRPGPTVFPHGRRPPGAFKGIAGKARSRKEGFVEKVGGRKVGQGAFLIPARAWPQLEALLQKCRAKRWALTVWIQAAT